MKQVPAPTAPMHPENPSMGNTQTKLDGLRAENHKEPEMSPSLGQSNHGDSTRLPSEVAVNATSGNSLEEPGASSLKGATNLGKRPAAQENVGAKKPKLNNEVTAPKPSLLVCLKLTPGKLARSTNDACDSQRKAQSGEKAFHGSSHSATASLNPQHSAPFTHESIPPHNSNAAQGIHQDDTAASNSSDPTEGIQDVARPLSMDTQNPQMDNADDKDPDDMLAQHKDEATGDAATTVGESFEVNDFLTKRMLHLYLQGQEESVGVVDLVKAKTHEKLFVSIKNTIADEIDDSDTIVAVSISREDEGPIEGTKKQKIPIKKNGDPSIWEALVTFIAKNGAGEGGLMGLVRVKKVGDAKGN